MRADKDKGKPVRLRDFLRVGDWFFSVVGYRNDPEVKCFLRYVPDEKGDRILNGRRYRKLTHDEAVRVGKYFKNGIFYVPHEDIDEVYKPEERLSFAKRAAEVRKIVDFFREAEIPEDKMGVTGSRLLGLEGEDSDVDFVVYGKWWFEAREKLRKGIQTGRVQEPDSDTWDFIYRKRKITMPYDVFLVHERRKYHRAFIGSTYFDLLYVRDYSEIDRDVPEDMGVKVEKGVVEAELTDDSLIFDYPGYYPIAHDRIRAVLCFTHTFVGQAFKGERILAAGDIEMINGNYYLVVGTKREVQDEFIVSLDLLEKEGLMEEFEGWYRGQA